MTSLLIPLAGVAGAVTRFLVDSAVRRRWPSLFWIATYVVNLSGSFLLGLISALEVSTDWRGVLGVGFCGGYTTFSTAMLETVTAPGLRVKLAHLLGMFVSCLLAVAAGVLVANLSRG